MNKGILSFLLYLILLVPGCIQPFEFDVEAEELPLVIESSISDVSYYESLQFPSDGRFFTTRLRYGQALNNKGTSVSNALVHLLSEEGEIWYYTEKNDTPGLYVLQDPDFEAKEGVKYKLQVTLQNDDRFESEWAMMPTHINGNMGNVSFFESDRYKMEFRDKGKDQVITNVRGVELTVDLPGTTSSDKKYYRWDFEATWIYLAGRLPSTHPNYKCWVRGYSTYLTNYAITEDISGGYAKEIVFIDVDGNHRFAEGLSILVKQSIISEDYYNFLRELQQQSVSSGIFDAPPYNLKTNYSSSNSSKPVFGYFSVFHEEAKRIHLSMDDLSFTSDNSTIDACLAAIPFFPPNDPCDNCLDYNFGEPTTVEPLWWKY